MDDLHVWLATRYPPMLPAMADVFPLSKHYANSEGYARNEVVKWRKSLQNIDIGNILVFELSGLHPMDLGLIYRLERKNDKITTA